MCSTRIPEPEQLKANMAMFAATDARLRIRLGGHPVALAMLSARQEVPELPRNAADERGIDVAQREREERLDAVRALEGQLCALLHHLSHDDLGLLYLTPQPSAPNVLYELIKAKCTRSSHAATKLVEAKIRDLKVPRDCVTIEPYLAQFSALQAQLYTTGRQSTELDKISALHATMASNDGDDFGRHGLWQTIIQRQENQLDLTLADAMDEFLLQAQRYQLQASKKAQEPPEAANLSTTPRCSWCNRATHATDDCRAMMAARDAAKKATSEKDRAKASNRRKDKPRAKPEQANPTEEAATAEHDDGFFTSLQESYHVEPLSNDIAREDAHTPFIMDSAATVTMVRDKNLLENATACDVKVKVYKDQAAIRALAKGEVVIRSTNGNGRENELRLRAIFVSGASENLCSSPQLDKMGYSVTTGRSQCIVRDTNTKQEIWRLPLNQARGLYILASHTANPAAFISQARLRLETEPSCDRCAGHTKLNTADLWHRRTGHPGDRALKDWLAKYGVKANLADLATTCRACNEAKMKRAPFKTRRARATRPGELVHGDMFEYGEGVGGFKYAILLTDDHTRYTHLFLLKRKDDGPGCLLQYKAQLEVHHQTQGHKWTAVQYDNGSELITNETKAWFATNGIRTQLSAPYDHEQNGLAERTVGIIKTLSACLLHQARLPHKFWPFAVSQATWIRNRQHTVALPGTMTPYEMRHNELADIDMIRVFGCEAYVHTPAEKRATGDPVSKRCIHLGLSTNHKAWIFLDLKTWKISVSGRAAFNESVYPSRIAQAAPLQPFSAAQKTPTQPAIPLRHRPRDNRPA